MTLPKAPLIGTATQDTAHESARSRAERRASGSTCVASGRRLKVLGKENGAALGPRHDGRDYRSWLRRSLRFSLAAPVFADPSPSFCWLPPPISLDPGLADWFSRLLVPPPVLLPPVGWPLWNLPAWVWD